MTPNPAASQIATEGVWNRGETRAITGKNSRCSDIAKKIRGPVITRLNLARITGLGVITVTALVGWSQPASGQPIYATGFERPMFVADAPLTGQDSWIAPPPFSPDAAVVTTDKPRLGRQTVHVLGEDLVHQDFINDATGGYYDAIGSYRRPVNYDTHGTEVVRVSANVRIDGPKTATGRNFFSAGIAGRAASTFNGDPSSASVGELAVSSDGRVYAYSGNDNVPIFLAGKRVRLGEWHKLAIVADFATHTSRFYVDGDLLASFAWEQGEVYTGVLLRGALLAYAAPDTARLKKAYYAAHYDQFAIKVVSHRDCGQGDD